MKYPFGMSFMKFLFLFVNFIFFPIFQKIRFALGQVAPHGKLCFRQIQRFAVIHFLLLLNLVIKKIKPRPKRDETVFNPWYHPHDRMLLPLVQRYNVRRPVPAYCDFSRLLQSDLHTVEKSVRAYTLPGSLYHSDRLLSFSRQLQI